ncbi:MAG: ATP-binding protein [Bacteroidetes bacterium]|nr:ATP-binding protein [Bacteroidota bacterium]
MNTATINPGLIDIIEEGNQFTLFYDNEPLKTPDGHLVSHENARLIYFIMVGLSITCSLNPYQVNGYGLFTWENDVIIPGKDKFWQQFDNILAGDTYVRMRTSPSFQGDETGSEKLTDFFLSNHEVLSLILGCSTIMKRSFNLFLDEKGFLSTLPDEDSHTMLSRFLKEQYFSLSTPQKAAINLLHHHYPSGIVPPLLLVHRYITPLEFACSLIKSVLIREMRGKENDEDLKENWLDDIREIADQGTRITEYLSFFEYIENESNKVIQLIHGGENDRLEFKSTLRWNIRESKKDPVIEHACLKTMAAFLNADGGTLLIGVTDNGVVEGLDRDQFENNDKFNLHLWNLIKSQLGEEFSPYIQTSIETLQGKTACMVRCMRSPNPVFLIQKGQEDEFFIRTGPSTTKLGVSDAYKYIKERFKQ